LSDRNKSSILACQPETVQTYGNSLVDRILWLGVATLPLVGWPNYDKKPA
jgi:hypothetical protein